MSKKLKNAPLQEVIFELRWQLTPTFSEVPNGPMYDPEYEFAQGLFRSLVKDRFPRYESIGIPDLPGVKIETPYSVQHRFRKTEQDYPLVQLGEGVLSVNDNGIHYEWDSFRELAKDAIGWLNQSYLDKPPQITSAALRYVDAVTLTDEEKSSLPDFLESKLKTRARRLFDTLGSLNNFTLHEEYAMSDGSILVLSTNTGHRSETGLPALLWQYVVVKTFTPDKAFETNWLDAAHNITSPLFVESLSKEYYDSFDA